MPAKRKQKERMVQLGTRIPEGYYRRLKVLSLWLNVPIQEIVFEGVKAILSKHPRVRITGNKGRAK